MKRISLYLLVFLLMSMSNYALAQKNKASSFQWVEVLDNGDATIYYRTDIVTNKKGNKIVWVKVNYHTHSYQLYLANMINSNTPVTTTKTKAEYTFDYGKVMVRQIMCYSKSGKLLYNSGDDTSAGWGYANTNDPLSVVAVYLLNKLNETQTNRNSEEPVGRQTKSKETIYPKQDEIKAVDVMDETNITNVVEEAKVYDVVEETPQFPGGPSALFDYLQNNLKYPVVAEENGVQGRVICKFIVEPDGSISDVEVTESVDPSLDREAVRLIKSMPLWTPGKQNGKPVRVYMTVPVTFRLQ